MYSAASGAPERFRILDQGQNRTVSAANHAIVVVIAAACIWFNPNIFPRPALRRGGAGKR